MPEPYHHTATNTRPRGRSIIDNLVPVLYRQTPAFIGIALATFLLVLECSNVYSRAPILITLRATSSLPVGNIFRANRFTKCKTVPHGLQHFTAP
jgi:hypothetical protein